MSVLLREVLLSAIGIESDLEWGTSSNGISAIDQKLLPPSAGALVHKIIKLGKHYKFLDELTMQPQENPYYQALCNSIESYLDKYRSTILEAERDIISGKMKTITSLVAFLEPYQYELSLLASILPPILSEQPIVMIEKIHEYVVSVPPTISSKFSQFERALHLVAILQLNSFVFYTRNLPAIFLMNKDGRIVFNTDRQLSFMTHQLLELLLLNINVASHTPDLFESSDPPLVDSINNWTIQMTKITSKLLADKVSMQWPAFFSALDSIMLIGRSDLVSMIARKLLQPHITTYDINTLVQTFPTKPQIKIEITTSGVSMRYRVSPPLDLIVTEDHQSVLSSVFSSFIVLATAEEAVTDMWLALKGRRKPQMIIGFTQRFISAIKEHIVFAIICPCINEIEKAGESISDFLLFQANFNSFIVKLSSSFSSGISSFRECIADISRHLVDLRELYIGKKMIEHMTDEQIIETITETTRYVTKGIRSLSDLMPGFDLQALRKPLEILSM